MTGRGELRRTGSGRATAYRLADHGAAPAGAVEPADVEGAPEEPASRACLRRLRSMAGAVPAVTARRWAASALPGAGTAASAVSSGESAEGVRSLGVVMGVPLGAGRAGGPRGLSGEPRRKHWLLHLGRLRRSSRLWCAAFACAGRARAGRAAKIGRASCRERV